MWKSFFFFVTFFFFFNLLQYLYIIIIILFFNIMPALVTASAVPAPLSHKDALALQILNDQFGDIVRVSY